MTKRQALIKTRNMWRWLEKNPTRTKRDYLNTLKVWVWSLKGDCYCCQYVNDITDDYALHELCRLYCPLFKLFSKGTTRIEIDEFTSICDHNPKSPYYRWDVSMSNPLRSKYAKVIADECDKLLKQKEKKKNVKGTS
jgi:hypothetical protein